MVDKRSTIAIILAFAAIHIVVTFSAHALMKKLVQVPKSELKKPAKRKKRKISGERYE